MKNSIILILQFSFHLSTRRHRSLFKLNTRILYEQYIPNFYLFCFENFQIVC